MMISLQPTFLTLLSLSSILSPALGQYLPIYTYHKGSIDPRLKIGLIEGSFLGTMFEVRDKNLAWKPIKPGWWQYEAKGESRSLDCYDIWPWTDC
jgi:hypothetical protein